ncbi:hypothetical protein LCGC14_2968780 [marine sediment metagenome]|uniref:Uncharacterized protein n=1 Tax=marine sediment metagenome TaxID=412755 RepID=A0A0F9A188_9ZZZZ
MKIFIELWKLGIEGAGYTCRDCWDKLKQYGFHYIYLVDERKKSVRRTDYDGLMAFISSAEGVNLLCSKEEVPI